LDRNRFLKSIVRIVLSIAGAGFFYAFWLAAFLLTGRLEIGPVDVGLWLVAPVVTAAGFAIGYRFGQRFTKEKQSKFQRIFLWPFVGCTVGAVCVFWFGPMLIVFGMFGLGTLSIAVREFFWEERDNDGAGGEQM
jgi:hypothetical protein